MIKDNSEVLSDTYQWFADWLTDENPASGAVDKSAIVKWLQPSMQNYVDGDFFRINPNGRALAEMRMLLTSKPGPADDTVGAASAVRPAARKAGRILLVSQYAPSFTHAGGLRIRDLYLELRRARSDLHLALYCPLHENIDGDISGLTEIFDEIVHPDKGHGLDYNDFVSKAKVTEAYDVIDLQFHEAGRLASRFRQIGHRLLFTPMESLARSYFDIVSGKLSRENYISIHDIFGLIHSTLDELKIVNKVDATICVSDADSSYLKRACPWQTVDHLATGLSPHEFEKQLEPDFQPRLPSTRQKRLVYAAYFGSDTNVVGLNWYLDHVHPLIVNAEPSYALSVVGRGDLNALKSRGHSNVNWVGEVPYLSPVLEQARGGLVLALHGSGFRGKINQYAICGVPTVSTPLGATGLCYQDGLDILLANSAADFADACLRLLTDDEFVDGLATKARATALTNYTWSTFSAKIAEIYRL